MFKTSMAMLLVGVVCFAATASPVFANRQTPSSKAEEEAQTTAFVKVCDGSAAAPLDNGAKAPPVLVSELLQRAASDKPRHQEALEACRKALHVFGVDSRFDIQLLRLAVADIIVKNAPYPAFNENFVTYLQKKASAGNVEAQFLIYRIVAHEYEKSPQTIDPALIASAVSNLKQAAARGHIEALNALLFEYTNGPFVVRDHKLAAETARKQEQAPMQGDQDTPAIKILRDFGRVAGRRIVIERDGFGEGERRAALPVVIKDWQDNKTPQSLRAYVFALRNGRGTEKDAKQARKLLERAASDNMGFIPALADMMARGEGGPKDLKMALAMLKGQVLTNTYDGRTVLANLYLDGKVTGTRPMEAIDLLSQSFDLDQLVRAAVLMRDYHVGGANKDLFLKRLTTAANIGEPGVAVTLARLKLSQNFNFTDIKGARALLEPLIKTDRDAFWLYLGSQYANLSQTSEPYRVDQAISDADLKAYIDKGEAEGDADAMLLKARMVRKGVVFRQDDVAATKLLIKSAKAGNVTAALLAGDAYQRGVGVERDTARMTELWRQAAKQGSLAARQRLAKGFTFDFIDRRITLEEGITSSLVLFFNGYSRGVSGVISSGAEIDVGMIFSALAGGDFPDNQVADATMKAFREAPAGLDEKMLVEVAKGIPEEIRLAMEKKLKKDGYLKGKPSGAFGPEVRDALVRWVDDKGPL